MSPIKTISAKMLDYFVGQPDAWIIDLREHSVYERSHIKGAVNVPYEELEGGYAFPKDKFLVFYCDLQHTEEEILMFRNNSECSIP